MQQSTVMIRLDAEQAHTCAVLHRRCFAHDSAECWSEENWRSTLSQPHTRAFGMQGEAGEMLAAIVWQVLPPEAEMLTLCTAPEARGQGSATALMQQSLARIEQEAREKGTALTTLFLEVAADNLAALALYHRQGFIETSRRNAYYTRGKERFDAILLQRRLNP